jgi:Heterokaryon incompatibility protein (HET)
MNHYQYQKLGADEIRLLEFQSLKDRKLAFNVYHKQLDASITPYISLSYTWGQAMSPDNIRLGDSSCAVTQNLHDALLSIQQYLANTPQTPKKLWIDAICIDQKNEEEKRIQIRRMTLIYIQAKNVYVWLGKPKNDQNMRLGVRKLKLIRDLQLEAMFETSPLRPWWWPRKPMQGDEWITAFYKRVNKDMKNIFDIEGTPSYNAWRGIHEIWQSDWWSRAWVMQEATVKDIAWIRLVCGIKRKSPNHKVVFFCGSYTTNWPAIWGSVLIANRLLAIPLLRDSTKFLRAAAANVVKVTQVREYRTLDFEINLLEQLQRARYTECLDPRDKIYATIGMLPKSISNSIKVNYSSPLIDVYMEVPRTGLEQPTPTLDFLGYAMKLDSPRRELSIEISHAEWPSWIPNWNDPLNVVPLAKLLYTAIPEQRRSFNPFNDQLRTLRKRGINGRAYNATRNETVQASIHGHQLHIKGAIIDTIVDRLSYQAPPPERRDIIRHWRAVAIDRSLNDDGFVAAIERVQVADIQYDTLGKPISRGNSLNNDLLNKRQADLTEEEETEQKRMRLALTNTSTFRGLCYTERGHIGVVPWSARPGDYICLLLGGQVLYVLRLLEDSLNRYHYIGECYIHTLMDGEALDWVRDGNSTIEKFVLI